MESVKDFFRLCFGIFVIYFLAGSVWPLFFPSCRLMGDEHNLLKSRDEYGHVITDEKKMNNDNDINDYSESLEEQDKSLIDCPTCKGGKIEEYLCELCKGQRTIERSNEYYSYKVKCNSCEGFGTKKRECSQCNGKGTITNLKPGMVEEVYTDNQGRAVTERTIKIDGVTVTYRKLKRTQPVKGYYSTEYYRGWKKINQKTWIKETLRDQSDGSPRSSSGQELIEVRGGDSQKKLNEGLENGFNQTKQASANSSEEAGADNLKKAGDSNWNKEETNNTAIDFSWKLNDRSIIKVPDLTCQEKEEGFVIVDIWVSADGSVNRAIANMPKSSTFNKTLIRLTEEAAMRSKFNSSMAKEQKGQIKIGYKEK